MSRQPTRWRPDREQTTLSVGCRRQRPGDRGPCRHLEAFRQPPGNSRGCGTAGWAPGGRRGVAKGGGFMPGSGLSCVRSNRWAGLFGGGKACRTSRAEVRPNSHASIGDFHEKAFGCATRNRDSFHRPVFGGYACIRVRRLRSEPPSRRAGPLRLGRSKSSLVPETHGPCSRERSQWDEVV
jgi:hypothetical protein